MLANRTSRWTIGAVLLCAALLAASWFLLISPRRADAVTVRGQAAQADSKAGQLQVQIAQLRAEFADLPKHEAELKAIKEQLPPTADIPSLVRDLQSLADQAGVSLDSLAPSSPVVLAASAGAAPAAAVPAAAGPGTVVVIPVAISVTGDYFEASLFVKSLQTKIQRSFLITGINVSASQQSAEPAATVTPTAVPTATAISTAGATATPLATATPATLSTVSMAITGSIFVLMDGTTTLEQVTKEAKAAAVGNPAATGTATPATGATGSSGGARTGTTTTG